MMLYILDYVIVASERALRGNLDFRSILGNPNFMRMVSMMLYLSSIILVCQVIASTLYCIDTVPHTPSGYPYFE